MRSWTMWLCASLFYAYQYVLRVIPSVLKGSLADTFHFDAFTFGQFAGIYFVGYTIAHIPLGLALDRYGPRWILPTSTLISVLGLTPLLLSNDWTYAIAGRFVLGLGSSCAFIGLVKVVSIAFSQNRFNRMLSYGSIFGLIGGVFAGYPVHYLLNYFGWRMVISISIVLGILLSIIMYIIIPSMPKQEIESPYKSLKSIFTNKWVIIVALGAGCMVGPLEGYADAWIVQTLTSLYGVTAHVASQGASLIYLSFAIGLPGLSYMVDKIGMDKTIITSGIFILFSFLALISGVLPLYAVPLCIFVLGFFCAYQVPALCRAASFTPKLTSLTTSIANTSIMFFGMFFHSVIGGCMQYFSIAETCNTDPFAYQKGFIIIPIMLILGIFMFGYVHKNNKVS